MKAEFIALFAYMAFASPAHYDDRQECRGKTEVSEEADCIVRGVYDPCDHASSNCIPNITATIDEITCADST